MLCGGSSFIDVVNTYWSSPPSPPSPPSNSPKIKINDRKSEREEKGEDNAYTYVYMVWPNEKETFTVALYLIEVDMYIYR